MAFHLRFPRDLLVRLVLFVMAEVGTPMRMTQILCLFVIIPLVVRRFGERRALYIACAGRAVGYGVFQGLSALPLLPVRAQQVL